MRFLNAEWEKARVKHVANQKGLKLHNAIGNRTGLVDDRVEW